MSEAAPARATSERRHWASVTEKHVVANRKMTWRARPSRRVGYVTSAIQRIRAHGQMYIRPHRDQGCASRDGAGRAEYRMKDILIGVAVFAIIFGGALLGMLLGKYCLISI